MTTSVKHWPAPKSFSRKLPRKTSTGSFWKWRGDRHHCGVDIFAPAGSPVLAVEAGRVILRGAFTSPSKKPYWNQTFFVLVQHDSGIVAKYAELGKVLVRTGQRIAAGRQIGLVGRVLNPKRVDENSPRYIRQMVRKARVSMLHFELYSAPPRDAKQYSGGNWFAARKPPRLLDPTDYLRSVVRAKSRFSLSRVPL
jgi:murein DD-endopeptidase MepM/ murein hydrolase activator NlpD